MAERDRWGFTVPDGGQPRPIAACAKAMEFQPSIQEYCTLKKSFVWASILIIAGLCSGCSKTVIKASDMYPVTPIQYPAEINLSTSRLSEDPLFSHMPFSGRISETYLGEIWNEVSIDTVPENNPAVQPEYIFNIDLIGIVFQYYKKGFSMSDRSNVGVLYNLEVYDQQHSRVHQKLFKIYGLWLNESGFVKGPLELKMGTHPMEATLKLGLCDIINYICGNDFSTTDSGGIVNVSHTPPGYDFSIFPESVFNNNMIEKALLDTPQTYYVKSGASILYFKFIMGETIDSVHDLYPSPWSEDPERYVLRTAKLAYDKKWPLFPKDLDVSALPYTFE